MLTINNYDSLRIQPLSTHILTAFDRDPDFYKVSCYTIRVVDRTTIKTHVVIDGSYRLLIC